MVRISILVRRAWVREVGLVGGGALLVALLAQASVPFRPVPLTGQTLGVLLAGGVLGARRGASALLLYLGLGAAGLPVFAGGSGGPAVLAGPTAGYLVGFVAAAGLVGFLFERRPRAFPARAAIALLGTAVIFAFGLAWLALYVPRDMVLAAGLWPFLPGALVKSGLAAALLGSRSWTSN